MSTPTERIRDKQPIEELVDDIQYLEFNAIFVGKTIPDYIRRGQYNVAVRTIDNVIGVLKVVKRDIEQARKRGE